MRLLSLLAAATLSLSACVVVPVGTGPITGPSVSQLQSQLTNLNLRNDVFAGVLLANGAIDGGHDFHGRGGSWSVNGSNLCLNFANRVSECGFAEFTNGVLFHQAGTRGGEVYDFQ